MAEPTKPPHEPESKSGVEPGETPNTTKQGGGKRPVEEEDVFGGAERTGGGSVSSEKAKP